MLIGVFFIYQAFTIGHRRGRYLLHFFQGFGWEVRFVLWGIHGWHSAPRGKVGDVKEGYGFL